NIKILIETSVSLSLIGLLVAWIAPNIYVFIIALLILGIPHGFTYTLSVITLSRTFPYNTRNAANSYFFSTMTVIGAVLPTILGYIVDVAGFKISFLVLLPMVITVFYFTEVFARKTKELLL
ncbi:MAG: MFS transporter, partial [Caldisphaera sp.]|nr:MFS transporter [Caldisphaera sp.]